MARLFCLVLGLFSPEKGMNVGFSSQESYDEGCICRNSLTIVRKPDKRARLGSRGGPLSSLRKYKDCPELETHYTCIRSLESKILRIILIILANNSQIIQVTK